MFPFRIARYARLVAVIFALAGSIVGAPASAATYLIDTTSDAVAVDGECTLREALLAVSDDATHNECPGDAGLDEIVLQAVETYSFTGGEIGLSGKQLLIRGELPVHASQYIIDMGSAQRFLSILNGTNLTLENLTLQNGAAPGAAGGAVNVFESTLKMRNAFVTDCAAYTGGAIFFGAENTGDVTLELERVELQGNTATDATVAVGGAVNVGLQAGGTVRLTKVEFLNNKVETTGKTLLARGAGLFMNASGALAIDLRYLNFEGNHIDADANATAGGADIVVSGSGAVFAEDLSFYANSLNAASGQNDSPAFIFSVSGPDFDLRRVSAIANNIFSPNDASAGVRIEAYDGSQGVVSDLLVTNGKGYGVVLAATGSETSLLAGNLTVTKHQHDGIKLFRFADASVVLENSITFGNHSASGVDLSTSGSPVVSAETQAMVGVDPHFVDPVGLNYRLQADSDAIDAGDQSFVTVGPFDVGHGTRVLGDDVDLGAYEFGAIFVDDFERGDAYAWTSFTL